MANHKVVYSSLLIYFPILTIGVVAVLITYSMFFRPSWGFNWSEIRQDVKDTIIVFEEAGFIPFYPGNSSGGISHQWRRRQWLIENTDTNELWLLLDHPSGIVKAIAYEGLLKGNIADKYNLLQKSLDDSTIFITHQSDIMMLSEFLILEVLNLRENSPPQFPEDFVRDSFTEHEIEDFTSKLKERMKTKWELYNRNYDPNK